jgi:hypothetical protein
MKRLDLRMTDELYAQLAQVAALEMRSLHSQATILLKEGLDAAEPVPAELPGQTKIDVVPDPKVKK